MERQITVYEKTTHGLRSTCEKWGVAKRKKKEQRLLLITGSGRSGTTYASRCMIAAGYDIPHERTGKDGTSSLFFTMDSDWYPMLPFAEGKCHVGERASDYEFEHVLHVVRHPLKTIPSIGKIFCQLNFELFEEQGIMPKGIKSKMLRCAWAYYGLNMAAERIATKRIKLEEFEKEWPKVMKMIGSTAPFPADVKPANKGTGFRASEPMTWEELRALDPVLCVNIMKMTKRYGYENSGL